MPPTCLLRSLSGGIFDLMQLSLRQQHSSSAFLTLHILSSGNSFLFIQHSLPGPTYSRVLQTLVVGSFQSRSIVFLNTWPSATFVCFFDIRCWCSTQLFRLFYPASFVCLISVVSSGFTQYLLFQQHSLLILFNHSRLFSLAIFSFNIRCWCSTQPFQLFHSANFVCFIYIFNVSFFYSAQVFLAITFAPLMYTVYVGHTLFSYYPVCLLASMEPVNSLSTLFASLVWSTLVLSHLRRPTRWSW